MTLCKLCGDEVRYVKTRLGVRIPLNVDPTSDGTIELVEDEDGGFLAVATGNLTLFHQEAIRYMPHWLTCPERGSDR